MWSLLAALFYGAAFGLALLLLYRFGHARWYWHALSLAVALFVGLMPPGGLLGGPAEDIAAGFVFLFLFTWGVAAPLFHYHHHHQVSGLRH